MGSTDSIDTLATSQDIESIISGSSGWGLTGSCPSPEVGLNKENSSSKVASSNPSPDVGLHKENSSSQVAVSEKNMGEREGKKQASPRDSEEKILAGKKGQTDKPKPSFKRKFSCVSSSQPICGTESDLGTTTNWEFEWKKQVQIAKKMRLRAERAEDKLEQVRSLLKNVFDYVRK